MTPQQLMTVRILWSSLLASNVLLLAVGVFSIAGVSDPAVLQMSRLIPGENTTIGVIWGASFLALGASFVLPSVLVKAAANASSSSSSVMQRGYTPFLLSMALAEACTLFGFVAALFMGERIPELMFLPTAAAVLAGLSRFPTVASFQKLAGIG